MSRPRPAGRSILPATPLGAVIGRDLRSWWRDPRRGVEVRSTLWAAFFVVAMLWLVAPGVLVFSGVLVALIGGMASVNVYAMDGTALWQLLLTPRAERTDVRGRQAWLIIFIPAAVVPTVIGLLVSQAPWAVPWVLALLPALLGGAAGLIPLLSVTGLAPKAAAADDATASGKVGGKLPRWQAIAQSVLFTVAAISVFPQGLVPLVFSLVGVDANVRLWFAARYLDPPLQVLVAVAFILVGAVVGWWALTMPRRHAAHREVPGRDPRL